MSPAHTKQHRDSHPHRDSLPAQSLPRGSGVGGAPLILCICICVRGSLVAVCVAVLACVLAGNMESALIVKLLGSWTGRGTAVHVLTQEDDVCGVVWTYVSISVHTVSSLCPKCP